LIKPIFAVFYANNRLENNILFFKWKHFLFLHTVWYHEPCWQCKTASGVASYSNLPLLGQPFWTCIRWSQSWVALDERPWRKCNIYRGASRIPSDIWSCESYSILKIMYYFSMSTGKTLDFKIVFRVNSC